MTPPTTSPTFAASCLDLLKVIEPALTFASTCLWGIYVWFTIKTFREIRRQTELNSQAYLAVTANLSKDNSSPPDASHRSANRLIAMMARSLRTTKYLHPDANAIYNKWR